MRFQWPVRRRPLSTPAARLSLVASAKNLLSTIALVHPLVTFSLTDTSGASAPRNRLISVSKSTEGILGRWRQLWGRAGVEKVDVFEEWEGEEDMDVTKEDRFGALGFFSLTASHSKSSQFICASPLSLNKCSNSLSGISTSRKLSSSCPFAHSSSSERPILAIDILSPRRFSPCRPLFHFSKFEITPRSNESVPKEPQENFGTASYLCVEPSSSAKDD